MRIYVFPFEKVEKNSRIILYGGGVSGKQYLAQLRAKNWAEVLYVVSGSGTPLGSRVPGTITRTPEAVFPKLPPSSYDYVVIAISSEERMKPIHQYLLGCGIPEKKIIWDIQYYDTIKSFDAPEIKQWFRPTFSWYGEDLIVKGIFNMIGIEAPTYLDIGCNRPYEGNNTAFLYLSGSHGVNVDASRACIAEMEEERPDDINICTGVAGKAENRPYYIIDEKSGLNSFSMDNITDYAKRRKLADLEIRQMVLPCLTLREIIDKYCDGVFPVFLDIDIEGLEQEVLMAYDFTASKPKVICKEQHFHDDDSYLFNAGYFRYFDTPQNIIFVQNTYKDRLYINHT